MFHRILEAGNILLHSYEAMGRFEDAPRLFSDPPFWTMRVDGGLVLIGVDPVLSPLRGHPRYDALVRRAGLPTASGARTTST